MLRRSKTALNAGLLFFLLHVPAHAETMFDSMATAYASHPKMLAARQALRIANEQYPQAYANWMPSLSEALSSDRALSRSKTATMSNSRTDTYKHTLSYSQNLYQGGRNFARLERADIAVQTQYQTMLQTEQAVLLDMAKAYMNVIRDLQIVSLRDANKAILEQRLNSTKVEYDLQQRTIADLSQAQARLRAAEAALIAAQTTADSAGEKYREMTGQVPNGLEAPKRVTDLPSNLDEMLEMAESALPAVIIARQAVTLADLDLDIENGTRLPSLALTASLSDSRSKEAGATIATRQRDLSAALTLTVPLYQSGAELSRVRAARQLVSQRHMELRDAINIARRDAVTAWRNLESARAQIESLREGAKAAETARDGIAKELAVGRRSLLDLLNAEEELLTAQVNLAGGERDLIVAGYEVLNAAGRLTARAQDLPTDIYDPAPDLERAKWNLFSTSE